MNEAGQPLDSDAMLVRRLQRGEASAFDALFERYRLSLLAYVRARVRDPALAEDIVQDCFLQMVEWRHRLDPSRSIGGWLFRVARNRTVDVQRHRGFEVFPGDGHVRTLAGQTDRQTQGSPADTLMQAEAAAAVERALADLSDGDRDLIYLRFYGGLTLEQIARVQRRPLGTVLWRCHRILKQLRRRLAHEDLP